MTAWLQITDEVAGATDSACEKVKGSIPRFEGLQPLRRVEPWFEGRRSG